MAKLNLIVIRSSDLNQAETFYEVIGLKFERHSHGTGPEHLACEKDTLVFEIYPLANAKKSTASTRIGFSVSDVDSIVSTLTKLQVEVRQSPKDSEWGRRAVVQDFDGHLIELTSPNTIPS